MAMGNLRGLGDRLNDARLVVGQHDRHNGWGRVFVQHAVERLEIDGPIGLDRDFPGVGAGHLNGFVLDTREQCPFAPRALQRLIVGFGAAAGKYDPAGIGPDQTRNRRPRILDVGPRRAAGGMHR